MDVFAHGLWTYALYHKKKYKWIAAFFGIMPDLIAFAQFFIFELFTRTLNFGKPSLQKIPNYVFIGYNFTHSLIIFFIVLIIIYFITRKIPWIIGGWLIHILIDIPTHTKEFFPTPFLWPISNYKLSVINWSNKYFMIINYSLLIMVYVYIIFFSKKLSNIYKFKNTKNTL